jgi:cell division protein FtsL
MHRHTSQPSDLSAGSGVPLDESPPRRQRLRRGGPRTPLPLLPLIAVAAGVGIAYVHQSAQATTATYQAAHLTAQHEQLRIQNEQLSDELARLASSERIVAAAQQFGMRPAGQWAYVAAAPVQVVPAQPARETAAGHETPVQRLLAALSGDFSAAAAP